MSDKLLRRIAALEASTTKRVQIINVCECWDLDCPQCGAGIEYNNLYLKHQAEIRSGSLSWESFFFIAKQAGYHPEHETYNDFMKEAEKW